MKLTEQTKKMFFLASYNIDEFKKFIFKSSFLSRYDVDGDTLNAIQKDEVALLKFGMKWLKWLLFKEGAFKLSAEATQKRQRQ
jgi:uncharacterized protein